MSTNRSTVHEFATPLPVLTPHGEGEAYLMIDYGVNVNTTWVVRLRGGYVKHYYSDDIRIYDNPMNGNSWDVDVPSTWKQDGKTI